MSHVWSSPLGPLVRSQSIIWDSEGRQTAGKEEKKRRWRRRRRRRKRRIRRKKGDQDPFFGEISVFFLFFLHLYYYYYLHFQRSGAHDAFNFGYTYVCRRPTAAEARTRRAPATRFTDSHQLPGSHDRRGTQKKTNRPAAHPTPPP